jgi:hypothetical protein
MTSRLLLSEEIIAGCCEQRKEYLNALCARKLSRIINLMAGQITIRIELLIFRTYFSSDEGLHSKYLSLFSINHLTCFLQTDLPTSVVLMT